MTSQVSRLDTLINFYRQQHLNCNNDNECLGGFQGVDDRTMKPSIAADYDLTPLIHFWGIQPDGSMHGKINGMRIMDQIHRLLYKTLLICTSRKF